MWLAFSVKSLPHTANQTQDVLIVRSTLLVCMHSRKCVCMCLCTPWLFSDFSVTVTCIMTDGMECPFMYLLTTCIFSPVECLLKSFASISIGLSFILPCESPQPVWDGRPLPNKWITVLHSPSVVHLFMFFTVFFGEHILRFLINWLILYFYLLRLDLHMCYEVGLQIHPFACFSLVIPLLFAEQTILLHWSSALQ